MQATYPARIPFGLAHFDVSGPSLDELSAFYRAVLGWTARPQGPGYAMLETPSGSIRGALVESEQASITIAVVVPDLDSAVANVLAASGSIDMPPTDNGWVRKALIRDPAGNMLVLLEDKPNSERSA